MRSHRLRHARLEAKALLVGPGPVPWLVCSMLVSGAFLQEPSIFRQQDMPLSWPFVFAIADLLSLIIVLQTLPIYYHGGFATLVRALGSWFTIVLTLLPPLLLGVLLDVCLGAKTPWPAVALSPLRSAFFWLPLCLLAQARWVAQGQVAWRFLWLGAAFLVQSAVLPASLLARTASLSTWTAALVAAAAGLVAIAKELPPSGRSRSSCE